MDVQKLAAFSDGDSGGNPAGVVVLPALPDAATMRQVAADVGFSETAFAMPDGDGWRVRYFSPASEVPFCGHATLALGAALARAHGDGRFSLTTNAGPVAVEGHRDGDGAQATLWSPPTRSSDAPAALVADALELFGLDAAQLDPRLPPARMHGGADHLMLALRERGDLAAMDYALDAGRVLMDTHELVTIALVHVLSDRRFATRNAFASGGVLEDPATGAAAAAFAGLLRDRGWPHGGGIDLVQGEDMGRPSRLHVDLDAAPGSPVRVSGRVRWMADGER